MLNPPHGGRIGALMEAVRAIAAGAGELAHRTPSGVPVVEVYVDGVLHVLAFGENDAGQNEWLLLSGPEAQRRRVLPCRPTPEAIEALTRGELIDNERILFEGSEFRLEAQHRSFGGMYLTGLLVADLVVAPARVTPIGEEPPNVQPCDQTIDGVGTPDGLMAAERAHIAIIESWAASARSGGGRPAEQSEGV